MRVTNGTRYIVLEQRKIDHPPLSAVRYYDRIGLRRDFDKQKKKERKVSRNERLARAGTQSIFVGSANPHAFHQECACGIPHAPYDRVTLTSRCELMALNNIDCVEESRAFVSKFMISDVERILGTRAYRNYPLTRKLKDSQESNVNKIFTVNFTYTIMLFPFLNELFEQI